MSPLLQPDGRGAGRGLHGHAEGARRGVAQLSVALVVTVVVPTGNSEPDAGVLVVGTVPLIVSIAEVANVTDAPPAEVA